MEAHAPAVPSRGVPFLRPEELRSAVPSSASSASKGAAVPPLLRSPCLSGVVRGGSDERSLQACSLGRELLLRAIPAVLPWAAAALFSTLKVRFLNPDPRRRIILGGRPFIGVLWHQQMLLSQMALGTRKAIFMSSRSRDGEISTRVLRRQGHGVVRGSSSAGGAGALREVIRLLREGYGAILIADGPKGPPRRSKPGCILAARGSGAPLLPIACAFSRTYTLRNWDQTAIPLPCSSVVIGYGSPIYIPKEATRADCDVAAADLDSAMTQLERRCRSLLEADRRG